MIKHVQQHDGKVQLLEVKPAENIYGDKVAVAIIEESGTWDLGIADTDKEIYAVWGCFKVNGVEIDTISNTSNMIDKNERIEVSSNMPIAFRIINAID